MPPPSRRTAHPDAVELRDHLEDAADHWFGGTRGWFPAIDLIRRPTELVVLVDVPGLKSDDVRIEVAEATLTISGERKEIDVGQGGTFLREERRSGVLTFDCPSGRRRRDKDRRQGGGRSSRGDRPASARVGHGSDPDQGGPMSDFD